MSVDRRNGIRDALRQWQDDIDADIEEAVLLEKDFWGMTPEEELQVELEFRVLRSPRGHTEPTFNGNKPWAYDHDDYEYHDD